jgi:hypothetical protein
MARLGINTGAIGNDGTGDSLRAAGGKINSNFLELYTYLGAGSTDTLSAPIWDKTISGINTLSNVGIGTIDPRFSLEVGSVGASGTSLWVNGDARITGILTVGTSSITLDGTNNTITVGLGVTIDGNSGVINASSINLGGATLTGAAVTYITAGSGISVDQSTGNVTITATGGGGGSQTLNDTLGLGNTSSFGMSVGVVTASSFVKTGGTSSQFLKADGSVDTSTYATETYVGLATTGLLSSTGNGSSLTGIVTYIEAGSGVSIDQSTGKVTITSTGGGGSGESYWVSTNAGIHTLSNVGIGTTNPTSTLTVNGNALISGVVTATTFVGNFSGSITDATNLTGGTANASSLNVSGITTISQGRIQADASSNLRFGNLPTGSGSGRNIAIGDQVLVSLSGGSGRNIGIGELSYYDTTTGQYNIGIGERAGQKVSTGSYNVILGAYDGNSGNLDIRTSSNNVVIADGQGNIRQYINSSGNVGIKTTIVTEALTVAGVVSATSFHGTLNASQLTGALPAIDGSALINVTGSGSGVVVREDGTPVGTAGTIDFGNNVSVSFASGIATVSGASSVSAATTAYALAGTPNLNVGVVTASRLISNSSIGIGTTNPNEEIHIYGSAPDIHIQSSSSTGAGQLYFTNNSGGVGFLAKVGSSYNNINYPTVSSNSLSLFNIDNAPLILGTNDLERFRIVGSGNAGFGTTNPTSKLTVSGDTLVSGIVTASSFSGSGSGLTNLPAGQLTGSLPAIDGSALLNVTAAGTGIAIRDDNTPVGSAVTVNFGTGLDVTFNSGIATITASGGSLQSRTTVTGVTTSIVNNGIGNTNITGFKSYALMKVGLSTAGWLRLYTDSTSRSNDASRSVGIDPSPGSGVIAEVVTTGISTTQIISPFVMGGNLDNPADTTIYAAITNLSGSTQAITANLTILQLEA